MKQDLSRLCALSLSVDELSLLSLGRVHKYSAFSSVRARAMVLKLTAGMADTINLQGFFQV